MSTRIYLLVATYEDEREPELLDCSTTDLINERIGPAYETAGLFYSRLYDAQIVQVHIDYDLSALLKEVL